MTSLSSLTIKATVRGDEFPTRSCCWPSCHGRARARPRYLPLAHDPGADTTVKLWNVDDGAVLLHVRLTALRRGPCTPFDGLGFVSGSFDNTACIFYHGLAASRE